MRVQLTVRGVRLKEVLRSVFEEVVKLPAAEGLLSTEEVCADGTKIDEKRKQRRHDAGLLNTKKAASFILRQPYKRIDQ